MDQDTSNGRQQAFLRPSSLARMGDLDFFLVYGSHCSQSQSLRCNGEKPFKLMKSDETNLWGAQSQPTRWELWQTRHLPSSSLQKRRLANVPQSTSLGGHCLNSFSENDKCCYTHDTHDTYRLRHSRNAWSDGGNHRHQRDIFFPIIKCSLLKS